MKKEIIVFIFFFSVSCLFAQLKTFGEVFPSLTEEQRTSSFSETGFVSYSQNANQSTLAGGSSSLVPKEITNNILNKNPGYYIEAIKVFPCNSSGISILDIYNAIGNIRGLKGRLYDSYTRGKPTPLFEDATRIASANQNTSVPDPAPVNHLPSSKETVYIRLKDVNFGNTYYRGEISVMPNGLSYSLTNNKAMTYLFITVIKAEQFTAQLYIEPIREGILIYSIAGVDISNFASNRIDINSAVSKRLSVITGWAQDEIIKKVNL